jgi:hypothetical protein
MRHRNEIKPRFPLHIPEPLYYCFYSLSEVFLKLTEVFFNLTEVFLTLTEVFP